MVEHTYEINGFPMLRGVANLPPMTIITYQPKRKRPTKAIPAAITGPRIVSAKGPSKGRKAPVETVVDPESEARVAEFFKRMIRPL
jgi:hypothetical protein